VESLSIGNTLAELDIYLRHCPLRSAGVEVLGSDEFRLAIAERIGRETQTPPVEIVPINCGGVGPTGH